MSELDIKAGVTYLAPNPGVPLHLAVVVYGPFIPSGFSTEHVIIVNLTSVKGPGLGDSTCILHAGDHEFLRHDTLVNYPMAECVQVSRLLIDFKSGRLIQKEPMRREILAKIYAGFLSSKHTRRKIRNYLLPIEGEATG